MLTATTPASERRYAHYVLGVLLVGNDVPASLRSLAQRLETPSTLDDFRAIYASLGDAVARRRGCVTPRSS